MEDEHFCEQVLWVKIFLDKKELGGQKNFGFKMFRRSIFLVNFFVHQKKVIYNVPDPYNIPFPRFFGGGEEGV